MWPIMVDKVDSFETVPEKSVNVLTTHKLLFKKPSVAQG